MVTKDDITRVRIVAGKEDREWDVEHITDNQYAVHYTDRNKQAKIVDMDNTPSCTCSYREYHRTCPHEISVSKFESLIDTLQSSGTATISMNSPFHCSFCDKIHRPNRCPQGDSF